MYLLQADSNPVRLSTTFNSKVNLSASVEKLVTRIHEKELGIPLTSPNVASSSPELRNSAITDFKKRLSISVKHLKYEKMAMTINTLGPKSDQHQIPLVMSMLCKTEWWWELRTQSQKMNLLNVLSASPYYFYWKWIGAKKWEFQFWS